MRVLVLQFVSKWARSTGSERLISFCGSVGVAVIIFVATVFLSGGYLFAGEQAVPARYRVFSLKHIAAERGKEFLEQAQIGTVSQLPGANVLLVTAGQFDLLKATALLELVDSPGEFTIGQICTASEASNLPSNEAIAAKVGGISIGSFSDPPAGREVPKAIIDMHKESVIVIAPVESMLKILAAIEEIQNPPTQTAELSEVVEGAPAEMQPEAMEGETISDEATLSVEPEGEEISDDELFGRLLRSLDEVERKAAAKAEEAKAEPNEPSKVASIAEGEIPPGPVQEGKRPEAEVATVAEESRIEREGELQLELERPEDEEEQVEPKAWSYEPEPVSYGNEMLELDLPDKLNIIDLLGLVGEYLNLDYMYDPAEVKGDVTLRLRGPIKVKELYPLLESVLRFKGFVMSRKGNLVTIVPAAKAMEIDPFLQTPERGLLVGDVVITRLFELQHIDTASAQNLLTGMKLGTDITPIPETGTLIVTEYAHRMARIEEILELIDKPGEPRQFRFRQLRYTMAKTLAPQIKSLVEQLGEVSITIAQPAAAPARPTPTSRTRRPARTTRPTTKPSAEPSKPSVYLDADERTNRIMMIGFESELNMVEELIDTLDVAQQDLRNLRLYEIQHVGAEEVMNKLQELGIISGTTRRTSTRPSPTSRGRTATSTPRPEVAETGPVVVTEEGVVEEPQVVIIESTNSLLVNATAEQHAQVALIISYVDSETLELAIPYEIYSLENQDPEAMAEVLNKLIQETVKDKEGKIEKVIQKEEDIVIVPDASTFSIIVYASKKNQEWVKKLIKTLDRRRPQVLIDVTLVEITRTDTFEYDMRLVSSGDDNVIGNILLSPIQDSKGGSFLEAAYNLLDGDGNPTNQTQAFYSDDKIQALLTAMQKKNYGRVLAKPKVLVDDGVEGSISTTDETTYVKETVQTPDQGPAITSRDFVPIQAKIALTITPHISEGQLLRLEVKLSRDDFGTRPAEGAPPDKATSEITTTVFVPDNHTVILGGLVKLNQTKTGSKVPLLGDIPLVGSLFRTVENSDNERKLYVFLKANIVRPYEEGELADLRRISELHRDAFEESEDEFQKHEDFPGIKPTPMPPERVLDEL